MRKADQDVKLAKLQKKEADQKVEEANQSLAKLNMELQNVDQQSKEQVAAVNLKIADAQVKLSRAELESKLLNTKSLLKSENPENGDLMKAILLAMESVIDSRLLQWKQPESIDTLIKALDESREINILAQRDRNPIFFAAPIQNGRVIVVVDNKMETSKKEIQIWDSNGSILPSIRALTIDHIALYFGKPIISTFTRNNRTILISGDQKGTIRLQDTQHPSSLDSVNLESRVKLRSISTSRDGGVIVAATNSDEYIRIWNSDIWDSEQKDKSPERIPTRKLPNEDKIDPELIVDLVAVDAKGETIVGSSKNAKDGKNILQIWQLNKSNKKYEYSRRFDQATEFKALAISPNGKTIVGGNNKGEIFVFDRLKIDSSGTIFDLHRKTIRSIAFLDDSAFVTSSDDGTIGLWKVTSDQNNPPIKLRGHSNEIYTVIPNLDTQTIFSGSIDGSVRLWDAKKIPNVNSFSDVNSILKFACGRIKNHPILNKTAKNSAICSRF